MTDLDALVAHEVWKDIPGYEGLYQASSLGRIRSLRFRNRYNWHQLAVPKIIAPCIKSKYLQITLSKDGVTKSASVHRLVLMAFVGEQPDGMEAGHLDGNRLNNASTNLAWISRKENAAHRVIHGSQQYGERCYNAKLTADDVRQIRATYKRRSRDANSRVLAERYGVSKEHIQKVILGKAWGHI